MNRRGFLGAVVGSAVAGPALAAPAVSETVSDTYADLDYAIHYDGQRFTYYQAGQEVEVDDFMSEAGFWEKEKGVSFGPIGLVRS